MLSRTSADGPSGRQKSILPRQLPSRGGMVLALLLLIAPIVVALVITQASGPLFGAWEWPELALILLLAETGVLLSLGMYRGEHNPYRTIVPSASYWGSHTNDPLVIYAGTLRPPIAADARHSSNNHPILLAIAPALGALVMLGIVLFGPSDDTNTASQAPAPLPIVQVERNLSLMLEEVDLTAERMTLTFQINDLQWASERAGYETPQADDLTLLGAIHEQPGIVAAEFMPIKRDVKPGVVANSAWRLQLSVAPPADPSQPISIRFHTIRFRPNTDIPDLPKQIDGDWSFTFIPAMS